MARIRIDEDDLRRGDAILRRVVRALPQLIASPGPMPPAVADRVSAVVSSTSSGLASVAEELDVMAADLRRRADLVDRANLLQSIAGPEDPTLLYLAGSTFRSIEDAEATGRRLADLVREDPEGRATYFRRWLSAHGDDPYYTRAFLDRCGTELLDYLESPPSEAKRVEFLELLAQFPEASALFVAQGEDYMRKVIDIRNSIGDDLSSSDDWEAFDIALGKVMVSGTLPGTGPDGDLAARVLFSVFGDLGDLDVGDRRSWREKRGMDRVELEYNLYQEPLAKVFASSPYVMSAFLTENQRTGESFLRFVLDGLNPDSMLPVVRGAQKVASRTGSPVEGDPFTGTAVDDSFRNLLATVRSVLVREAQQMADDTNAQQRWIARTGGAAIGLITGPPNWVAAVVSTGAGVTIEHFIDDFDEAIQNIDNQLVEGFAVRWVASQAVANHQADDTARAIYKELNDAGLLSEEGDLIPPERMSSAQSRRLDALLENQDSALRYQVGGFARHIED